MNLIDLLDIFSNLSFIGNKDSRKKRPKIYMLFIILVIPGISWFLIELQSILKLTSPFLFILIFVAIGVFFCFALIVLIHKLGLIDELSYKEFFTILIPVILLVVSLASLVNRHYEIVFQKG